MTPFRVLVVDDSPFMRKIISDLIERDRRFQVTGTANNGREAIVKARELDPDIITMDVEMPEMNGLDALKTIMETGSRAVIMLSGVNEQGMRETILALEFGAFDFIRKPSISNAQDIEQVGRELLKQLNAAMQAKSRRALWEEEEQKRQDIPKAILLPPRPSDRQPLFGLDDQPMSLTPSLHKNSKNSRENDPVQSRARLPNSVKQVPGDAKSELHQDNNSLSRTPVEKVFTPSVRRKTIEGRSCHPVQKEPDVRNAAPLERPLEHNFTQLVAVGCSTGGPRALKTVLENIPGDFPAPIVIVQHMPPNFTKSLAQRLDTFCALEVVEACDEMELKRGTAYIAPGGSHMRISSSGNGQYRIAIHKDEPCNGHRPSVDVLFESLLPLTSLKRHVVLMTGMGSDGARMMKRLYDAGVTSTFAESEETCIVYGMPRSAVELGCVSYVLPLQEIAGKLVQAVNIGK